MFIEKIQEERKNKSEVLKKLIEERENKIVSLFTKGKAIKLIDKFKQEVSFEISIAAFTIEDRINDNGTYWQSIIYLDVKGDLYYADPYTKNKIINKLNEYNSFTRKTHRKKERKYYYSYAEENFQEIATFNIIGTFMFKNEIECPKLKEVDIFAGVDYDQRLPTSRTN